MPRRLCPPHLLCVHVQEFGEPSQAHKRAAAPDCIELACWALHTTTVWHRAAAARAAATGMSLEAVKAGPAVKGAMHLDMQGMSWLQELLEALGEPPFMPDPVEAVEGVEEAERAGVCGAR